MIIMLIAAAAATMPIAPERVEVEGATFRMSVHDDIVMALPTKYRVRDALRVKQLARKAVLKFTDCKIVDELFVPEMAGAVYQAQIECP